MGSTLPRELGILNQPEAFGRLRLVPRRPKRVVLFHLAVRDVSGFLNPCGKKSIVAAFPKEREPELR